MRGAGHVTLSIMAMVLCRSARAEGVRMLNECVQGFKKRLGPDHPRTRRWLEALRKCNIRFGPFVAITDFGSEAKTIGEGEQLDSSYTNQELQTALGSN